MEDIRIERTGKRPLEFKGERIGGCDTSQLTPQDVTRWHDIDIYRTKGGAYVVSVEYLTQWAGEHGTSFAVIVENPLDVERVLTVDYDPTEGLIGFPPGEQFREKRQNVIDELVLRYKLGVSRALAPLPETID